MIRRARARDLTLYRDALRLFSTLPVKNFQNSSNCVTMSSLLDALVTTVLPSGNVTLLRSEPQSGKTSFLNYCDGRIVSVNGETMLLKHIVASESPTAISAMIRNESGDKQTYGLLLDEAHKIFDDSLLGNFMKNEFGNDGPTKDWRLLLVGTTSSGCMLAPSTPFDVPSFYMAPQSPAPAATVARPLRRRFSGIVLPGHTQAHRHFGDVVATRELADGRVAAAGSVAQELHRSWVFAFQYGSIRRAPLGTLFVEIIPAIRRILLEEVAPFGLMHCKPLQLLGAKRRVCAAATRIVSFDVTDAQQVSVDAGCAGCLRVMVRGAQVELAPMAFQLWTPSSHRRARNKTPEEIAGDRAIPKTLQVVLTIMMTPRTI
jgi:hypothetical protein